MQVDHLIPVHKGGKNELDNYMPACRMCNFYKSTLSLEDFREQIGGIQERLSKLFIYKMAISYNLILENKNDEIIFYFERRKCKDG